MTRAERAASHANAAAPRGAVSLGWGGLAGALAYAVQRVYEWVVAGPVDPLLVVRDAHVGFYWRASSATWWAGTVVALVWLVTAHPASCDRAARWLGATALPLAMALALAMAVCP